MTRKPNERPSPDHVIPVARNALAVAVMVAGGRVAESARALALREGAPGHQSKGLGKPRARPAPWVGVSTALVMIACLLASTPATPASDLPGWLADAASKAGQQAEPGAAPDVADSDTSSSGDAWPPANGDTVHPDPSKIILADDFDACSLDRKKWRVNTRRGAGQLFSQEYTRDANSKCALHIAVNPGSGQCRNELIPKRVKLKFGKEYCISYSMLLRDWSEGMPPVYASGEGGGHLFQTHAVPGRIRGKADFANCEAGKNSIGLKYGTDASGQLDFEVRTVKNQRTFKKSASGDQVYAEPMPMNKWMDITIRHVPSTGNDGIVEIWKDGEEIVSHMGSNLNLKDSCGNDLSPWVQLHLGIYFGCPGGHNKSKKIARSGEMNVYFDNFELAEGKDACVRP